jgi:hypothetical protein
MYTRGPSYGPTSEWRGGDTDVRVQDSTRGYPARRQVASLHPYSRAGEVFPLRPFFFV